jgi:hypothetical protein
MLRSARFRLLILSLAAAVSASGCRNGSSPSGPTAPPPVTPPQSQYSITTLLTVYPSAEDDALFTRGTTSDERIGQILLGVSDIGAALGSKNLNNEEGRVQLQAAIDRLRAQFRDSDYRSAFDETRENLERYLNDADGDGWSIDGRHGPGRDWPYDNDGNDPDGWTAQMVVTVTRVR